MNANQIACCKTIALETVCVNGDAVSNLSEAVVAVCHVEDDTSPAGVACSATRAACEAWRALSDDERRELWDLACAGKLDYAADPDPGNVTPIR